MNSENNIACKFGRKVLPVIILNIICMYILFVYLK